MTATSTPQETPVDQDPLYRPWGTVTPESWTGTPAPTTEDTAEAEPLDVPGRLARIHEAATAGEPEKALLLAEELDTASTAAHGELHLATIQVREIRGYLTDLAGHPDTALAWYLHTARLRSRLHGPHAEDTDQAVRRAYSLWRHMPAPQARATAEALLATITEIQGENALATRWTRRRITELSSA
ncbi:hypothetical protein [Streptomyces sp. NPDC086023]|uniref:hypothetical protein n=1 Tax=Streptomyces sp. NPDC086023 TaxID=3365746 RepID=UPI0037D3EC6D